MAVITGPHEQHHRSRVVVLLVRAAEPGIETNLVPLDGADATAVGLLLAETAMADIVDAHVVICARRTGQVVVRAIPETSGESIRNCS